MIVQQHLLLPCEFMIANATNRVATITFSEKYTAIRTRKRAAFMLGYILSASLSFVKVFRFAFEAVLFLATLSDEPGSLSQMMKL
jgi:hypothetical protein